MRGLLDEVGWTQRVLAVVLGVGETSVNKIASDRQAISADMALMLGDVLGIAPERFLLLQQAYNLQVAKIAAQPDPGRATRAHLIGKLPVTEMIKRGWIRAADVRDVEQVESELVRFFGVTSPGEIEILPHAAKKTQVSCDVTPVQLAWLFRVKQIAGEMVVPRYSSSSAKRAVERLRDLLVSPEAARKVPRILTEAGIRFVIVESLPGAKIDGACFWLNESSPVVGMSLRHDRIDNFWFVLRHELEHVLRRHGQGTIAFDAELEGDSAGVGADIPKEERVANQAAASFCVPTEKINMFVERKAPYFAERDVLALARMVGVHPGLVVGQIHHSTNRYELLRRHLVKIRPHVAPEAVVDGWGDVVPVDV